MFFSFFQEVKHVLVCCLRNKYYFDNLLTKLNKTIYFFLSTFGFFGLHQFYIFIFQWQATHYTHFLSKQLYIGKTHQNCLETLNDTGFNSIFFNTLHSFSVIIQEMLIVGSCKRLQFLSKILIYNQFQTELKFFLSLIRFLSYFLIRSSFRDNYSILFKHFLLKKMH